MRWRMGVLGLCFTIAAVGGGCGGSDNDPQPIEQPYELERAIELARLSLYAYAATTTRCVASSATAVRCRPAGAWRMGPMAATGPASRVRSRGR